MKLNAIIANLLILFLAWMSTGAANAQSNVDLGKREIKIQSCDFIIKSGKHAEIMLPREENNFKSAGYSELLDVNGVKQKFGFSLGCLDDVVDKNSAAKEHGGYFNIEKKQWEAYYVDDQDRSILAPVTHLYVISTPNGEGFARTTDDVVGDESQRGRSLSYCLFHNAVAICGEGQVMSLADPKANFLPSALNVLRSVEFVDISK